MFTGDQVGYIKCYDIQPIFDYDSKNDIIIKKVKRSSIKKEKILEEYGIKIILKWQVEAHKESIKHLYHVDIEPRIIISTSNDLHIKIFGADDGEYKDELRQISVKYKPVPIGIKYSVNDPFKSRAEQTKEEFIIYRDEIKNQEKENIEDIENQQSK
jgi:hypothetical protein